MQELTEPGARAWNGLAVPRGAAEQPDVVVIGVPFEGGAGGAGGASLGPGRVRELSNRLKTTDRRGRDASRLRLLDRGDVETWRFDLPRTIDHVREVYRSVFDEVTAPVLTFGGDHSLTYPIVCSAARGRDLGLVWFDAHPDVLDGYQGSTISHGSPLRRIVEEGAVAPENVLLVGTRAYDAGEVDFIRANGINEVPAAAFTDDPAGARQRYLRQLAEISGRVGAFYVTVDIDVLDASCVPGTGTPVAGGIGSGELLGLLEGLPEPVLAYDIVEFAPSHDVGGMTGHAVMAITTAFLARIAAARD
ncbi:arginase family protein [Streptomyces clavuligerus]|uniref:Arginase/agmatinase/formiminoglutamase n=1 Tax=Streptomyces clavuligerus TaxID=1901 RepID=E2Q712_STRCL|nr:arginase family protein [Streptomyces clavuligerus]ANW21572.1 arginase [Streptomyces clavuligerus]AXU16200.1 arginase family protein [Streptomyces clavuligerus]EFG05259.1 Arginase/agmatinase/formiminoglutamase [Streptomyces clavuligerus]MBY6306353.1 arginase family protein [Streptomyces clavuligerus]QCS08979.1 arginase [Streptomyces clavuligerus]